MKNIFKKKETIEIYGCDHVQHKWLSELSWKMQTVINQGLRAPDTHFCKKIKLLCRWMRGVVLQNADKEHTFMCSKKEADCLDKPLMNYNFPKNRLVSNENYELTRPTKRMIYSTDIQRVLVKQDIKPFITVGG